MPAAPYVFNVRASYEKETAKAVDTCVKAGKTHIGTFVQDDAYGKDGEAGTISAVKAAKATLTASTSYKRGTGADADMSPAVKILRDAGTDCISTTGSYAALSAFIRAARSSGWDVPIFGVSHTGADQLMALLQSAHVSTDKLVVTQVVPSPDDPKLAVVKEYRAAMDKYKPNIPNAVGDGKYTPATNYSFGSLEGYLDMKLLGVALAKAGKDLTRARRFQSRRRSRSASMTWASAARRSRLRR